MTAQYIGFGFNPQESLSHFYILIPKNKTKEVEVYERFEWSDGEHVITIPIIQITLNNELLHT